MLKQIVFSAALLGVMGLGALPYSAGAQAAVSASKPAAGVLTREETAKILPPSVFYRGQSAPVQGRNSAGIRVAGGKLVLAALVDNSGYSSGIAERYQAYLITEVPLQIGDKKLVPGCYGFGFLDGNRLVVMDVGANEVLATATTHDEAMKRPNPLQIEARNGSYRLYLGRNFVTVQPMQ